MCFRKLLNSLKIDISDREYNYEKDVCEKFNRIF